MDFYYMFSCFNFYIPICERPTLTSVVFAEYLVAEIQIPFILNLYGFL